MSKGVSPENQTDNRKKCILERKLSKTWHKNFLFFSENNPFASKVYF